MNENSLEYRLELSRLIMALLESWSVPPGDQIRLLALPVETKPRNMRRYREDTPLPDEPQVRERIEHLVGIADALRTSYPRNIHMASTWMNSKNPRFGNRKPLQVMLEDGLDGIVAVRMHLDCAWDWDRSGSRA